MEIKELITYLGMVAVVVSVIIPTSIQLRSAKKSGIYGSVFTKIESKDKNKLKAALLIFILGMVFLAIGSS
jgi:hypothetical protein